MITEKLRQGDILRSAAGNYYFVLTPDCDIYNNKFRNAITVLKLSNIQDYIKTVYFDKELNEWMSQYKSSFIDHEELSIDEYFFDEYIIKDDPDEVYGRYFDAQAPQEFKWLRQYYLKEECSESIFLKICKLRKAKPSKKIKNCLKNISIDFFFINQIPKSPEFGFIIDLRIPETIEANAILLSDSDVAAADIENYFIRLGAMPDDMRFAVAQAFAYLFSRIGLPTDFEVERSEIFKLLEEEYS